MIVCLSKRFYEGFSVDAIAKTVIDNSDKFMGLFIRLRSSTPPMHRMAEGPARRMKQIFENNDLR